MKKSNFEEACEKLGIASTLPGVEGLPEAKAKAVIAGYKLDIIADATGKRTNNFSNGDWKYTPWLEWSPSAGCFVLYHTYCTITITLLGARFYFTDSATARKFFEDNEELINDLHQGE